MFFFSCVFPTSNILFCHLMSSRGYLTTKLWPRDEPLLSPTSSKKRHQSRQAFVEKFTFKIAIPHGILCGQRSSTGEGRCPYRSALRTQTSICIYSSTKLRLTLLFICIKTKAQDCQNLFLALYIHQFLPEMLLQTMCPFKGVKSSFTP